MTLTRNSNKKGPDDMEIDALTKKGKSHKGKGKHKTDGQKTSCSVCGRVGHMPRDCSFKDTSKGVTPNNRSKKKVKARAQAKERTVSTGSQPRQSPQ